MQKATSTRLRIFRSGYLENKAAALIGTRQLSAFDSRRRITGMAERPPIRPGDWIIIGRADCVVSRVYPPGDPSGDCEVVHNPAKPSNDDAFWDGEKWQFKPGASGYADKYERLNSFVRTLKRGRSR
jgi:hypothetical protein